MSSAAMSARRSIIAIISAIALIAGFVIPASADDGVVVSGVVVADDTGQPIADLDISLLRDWGDDWGDVDWTQTNSRGEYSFTLEPGVDYKVQAYQGSSYRGGYLGGTSFGAATTFTTNTVVDGKFPEFRLTPRVLGNLIATVTDDGALVRDAYVVAYRWVEEHGGYWAWTSGGYSDASGRVLLRVDLGTYTLAAESLGSYLGGATSMPDSPNSSNSVQVTGGGDATVSFSLAPASIVGVVEDGGFPVSGVSIDAYRWDPDWESWSYYRWAYTDVAGKYRLVLEPGTYTFAYDGQFLGGGADLAIAPTASNSVVVTADAPKTVDFSLPARGLYGTVTEGGDAFGGAVVTAYRWNAEDGEWGWTDSTTADDLGRYRMRLGAGIYTLSFGSEDSGYLSYLGGGASLPGSPDSASSVTLGGEDAQTVDLSMPAPNLKGKVTESGEPVRAWVQAYRWVESDDDGAYWDYDASGSAGPDGTYRMQLKSGTYTFSFDGYFLGGGTGWPGAPSSSNSVEITADATKLNFALPSQSVRGAVTEAGKPLEYAGVTAYRWDQATGRWGTTYYTSADEDGRYRLRLDPGVYALRFTPDNGDHSFYLGGGVTLPSSPAASNSVTIVGGSDKTVDFAVPAPNVTGTVTEAGSPLATWVNVYRWVDGEDGGWDYVSEAYSRQDGGYRTWLGPGVYTFQAAGYFLGGGRSTPGAPTASNSVTLAAGVPQVVNLAIPAPNVTGTVTANGSTVMDVEVSAYKWVAEDGGYWEYWADAYTDDDGTYKLRLGSGTYTFRFDNHYLGGGLSRPTSPTAQNSRVVVEGTPQTVNFALPETFTASGKLTAASGSVKDARVQLYLWDSALGEWVYAQRETYAAADGTFSLTRVPEGGPYTLRVVKSKFAVGILGGGEAFGAPTAQNSFSVAGANKTGLNVALAPRVSTLGKVAGQKLPFCQANELHPNDDDSTGAIDVPFPLRYFGNTYTQLYVNNNGNVTFDGPLSQYTPDSLDGAQSKPIIAPFFADVDTRDTTESDIVTYGASPDGTQFCVNWVDVEPYQGHDSTGKLNSFQLLLTKKEGATGRSAGDFDITFNYDQIQWDAGTASRGVAAVAGYASGSGEEGTFFQLPGSMSWGAFLNGGSHALVGGRQNSSQVGRYEYQIRNDGHVSTLGNLTGKVLLPGGGPAANVYVEVVSGSRAYYTRANASGTYSVSGIAAGPYTVRAWPESDDLIQAGASATVVVGETTNAPDIKLGAPAPMPPSVGLTSPSFGTAIPNQVPSVYYQDPLTLSYDGATGGTASYKVVGLDGSVIREGVLAEQSPGKYRGTIPPLYPATGNATVQITFTPASGTAQQIAFNIYIDPSGVVLDKWGFPVAGATATLLRSEDPDEEPFVVVPNGSDIMSPRNRKNPDTTDEHGLFGWDVTAAWYKVRVAKSGYTTFESGAMEVPPERLDLVFTLAGGSAPSLTSLVGGTPTVGAALTAHKPDGLSDEFEAVGYRWFRDGSRIDGADAKTYTVVAADAGKKVHAEVTVKRRSVAVDPLHPTENIVEFAEIVAPSATVAVAKLRPTLALVGTAGAPGEATLSATLALPGTAVNATAATLKILDDGKELSQTIAVKNGNGLVTLTGLTPGKHTFTVGFAGDAAHDAVVSGAAAVTVAAPPVVTPGKAKPTLTLAGAPGKAGEAKLTATLTVPGKAAKGTTATLKILDGKTVLKQTVAIKDGKGSVTLKGLKPGKHSFTVSYAGDANMEAATSKAAAVTVAKHVPTVALKAKAGKKKGTATLDVTLKLPGTAAKSTKATLKIYDGKKLLKQTVKIKNGKGKVTLSKLAAGRHPFTVVYTGDSTYSKATSKVASVGKDKPKLTVKAKAGKKGKATLTVTLKLPGTAAKSTKATLKVYDGKKLLKQKISVKKGKGTVSLSKLKKGTHTFKVTYAGNSSYEAKSVTAKATIK